MTGRSRAPAVLAAALIVPLAGAGAAGLASSAPVPPRGLVHPGGEAAAFKDGPPARVTGGFGEESCWACHFDGAENDPEGRFGVEGFPKQFEPGETYRLELSLTRPGLAVAGFQLAVRFAEDQVQAGRIAVPPEEEGRGAVLEDRDVLFAHHLLEGIEPAAPDTARWTILWTAPESGGGRVLLHAATVAGNGDDSQFGDHVYTREAETRPGSAGDGRRR